jgi:hypothetical protein
MELETLLTTKDLERLQIAKVSTLRLWHREGFGPRSLFIGGRIRYRPSDVVAWLNERSTGGGEAARGVEGRMEANP